jgi:hypothetical protein
MAVVARELGQAEASKMIAGLHPKEIFGFAPVHPEQT